MRAPVHILGKASSINVRKVLWTCDELGLEYGREDWGSGFRATDDPDFLRLNPNGLVPVLVDGDFVLWESNTICRYLAAREQRADLLPTAARERAMVEQWMDWQATDLNSAWRYAFMALVRRSPAHADPVAIEASVAAWNRHMQVLDARLQSTGAFMTGAHFTLADIPLGLSTHRWLMAPVERPALPAVADYYERLRTRPGFQRHGSNGLP